MGWPIDPALQSPSPYRPLRSTATFLLLLFGLFIIATLVLLATGWEYRAALLDMARSDGRTSDAVRWEDNFLAASGLLGGVNIILATSFIFWFWRAYSNLAALGKPTRRRPGWAIGAWVVPIANFFIPYQIGSEIWRKSLSDTPGVDTVGDGNIEPVISWWALFLLMGLVNQVAFFSGRDVGDDFERMAAVLGVDVIGGLVSIAAAIAALRFVRRATIRQERAAALRFGSDEGLFP